MTRTVVIDRDKFYKVIEGDKQSLTNYILKGQCVSFEDYRNKTGQLRGIETAIDHFKDTIKSEDEDE